MDKIEEFTLQQVIDNQERVIKEQKEDIERLQAQLNKEIHYNRIMKRALEKYAECEPLEIKREYFNNEPTHINKTMADIGALAKQVLKEIDNKE